MFITLKRKYLRKKRDLKDVNKSGTFTKVVLKAQKSFRHYEFMKWLDDFVASRQGKIILREVQTWRRTRMENEMTQDCLKMKTHPQFHLKKLESYQQTKKLWKTELKNLITSRQAKQTSFKKTYVKIAKKKRSVIKGTAKENLIDNMELSLIKDINDPRKKKKNRG